jgi:hypothetical protein
VTARDWAALSEWTRRSRERQGLPARITDPVVLSKVAALLSAGLEDDDAPARRPRRRTDHPATTTQRKGHRHATA